MTTPIETFDFTRNGAHYTARVYVDDSQGPPWSEAADECAAAELAACCI